MKKLLENYFVKEKLEDKNFKTYFKLNKYINI